MAHIRIRSSSSDESGLDERSRHLLKVLVESYIREGQPVGSRLLSQKAGLDISPATVRNVVADLESMGFVRSPHTSAGRVPTARGYRLFVDTLLQQRPPDAAALRQMRVHLSPGRGADDLVESASNILSGITQLVGVVTVPRSQHLALRQIEFLALSDKRVLVILVMNQHEVQNRILQLDRAYTQSELDQAARYLNLHFAGRDLMHIRGSLLRELDEMRADMDRIMRNAVELGQKALEDEVEQTGDYVLAGQNNLLEYQELADLERLRTLFSAFTEKREVLHLLDKSAVAEDVQIFIGHESGYGALDYVSVVTAPYVANGEVIGMLGVIGPTRMPYDRVIPVVDITARLLGSALNGRA
ncbi:heat-inducible transcriptional repressor HrcA [Acidihalobacter prosperus]|uniref:Heat-inducible transcription repressor HrcA n=1 Tax=Acidihalobacter prosperus TaxID=160660 RepID=A0A1A6C6Z0_9GAMM|nr:heat-inducible transcriptional repressor HrcA [Acidihalobacter prosperus]OBS10329.1 Heat-inducible transcription repressor HrcA [Acidihalobacter prosperus]